MRSARPASSSQWCVATSTAPPPLAHVARDLPERAALRRVERGGRLVEQQHPRRGEQRDRDVEPLPVADGERGRAHVGRQLELGRAARRRAPAGTPSSAREEAEVLARRQPPVVRRALRHPADRARAARPCRRSARARRRGSTSSVDLPAPFGPTSATTSPASRSTSVGRRATRDPKARETPRAASSVISGRSPAGGSTSSTSTGGASPSPRLEVDPVGEELPERPARRRAAAARSARPAGRRARRPRRARRSRAAGAAAARCPSRSARRRGPRSGGCRGRAARPRGPRSGARRARRGAAGSSRATARGTG